MNDRGSASTLQEREDSHLFPRLVGKQMVQVPVADLELALFGTSRCGDLATEDASDDHEPDVRHEQEHVGRDASDVEEPGSHESRSVSDHFR